MSCAHPDVEHREDLLTEAAYLDLVLNECSWCGGQLPETPFDYRGKRYCDPCALAMTAHIERGAIPHGGTEADPDSLELCGVAT